MSYILGLGGPYFHDSSACIINEKGEVLAFVEEERFTRKKNNKDSRSCSLSAAYCLARVGIKLNDVTEIAVAWNPYWPNQTEFIVDRNIICELLDPRYFDNFIPKRLRIIEHHLAHAASAFYFSGFENSAVLVIDGSGDGISTSIYSGSRRGLKLIKQYPFTQSLGWFYESVGEFLGLGNAITSSGKLMGLSAYGKPIYDLDFIHVNNEDGYFIDLSKYGLNYCDSDEDSYSNLRYYRELKNAYKNAFTSLGFAGNNKNPIYDFKSGSFKRNSSFSQNDADLAASAQEILQKCILNLVKIALPLSNSSNLCLSGGVALNCSANGLIYKSFDQIENFFVQPIAGDAGCSIGASFQCLHVNGGKLSSSKLITLALGPSFSDTEIHEILTLLKIKYTYWGDQVALNSAKLLAKNKIIGWFQGACEAGPRALGHRSILANPIHVENRDIINRDIKKREMWRPFAPSIIDSEFDKFAINSGPSDFMIIAYNATEFALKNIPAAIHFDKSIRPQKVTEAKNKLFHNLLVEFKNETGIPALLNTSFNRDGEPIVCSPTDAIRTFYSTAMDALVIGGFCIEK